MLGYGGVRVPFTGSPNVRSTVLLAINRLAACLGMLLALAFPAAAFEGSAITAPGDYTFTLDHDGSKRQYRVHVPPGYSAERPMPVVLSLHGGGGNMNIQADDRFYRHISKSDAVGYVAVFPNGFSRWPGGRLATWNAGHCCGAARDRNVDDVGFIREIVRRLAAEPGVDARRFFVDGMSNGAMMAYRLACEMPGTFRAIAAVAGTDNTKTCTPTLPVSVLHVHARDDERVLFGGGAGEPRPEVADFTSVPATIDKWVRLNGCTAPPTRVLERGEAYCEAYAGCRGDARVQLCVTPTGGHSWPGGAKPRGGRPGSSDLSATDLIWEFFSTR